MEGFEYDPLFSIFYPKFIGEACGQTNVKFWRGIEVNF